MRSLLDDFRPEPFSNGEWVSLANLFEFRSSGLQTKRDKFVYDVDLNVLAKRITSFVLGSEENARSTFHDTRDRKSSDAQMVPFNKSNIEKVCYRPLDRRFLYNHRQYGDFLRPQLQSVWGNGNLALYSMPMGVNLGPGAWCHGKLPDYHAFSGRGGYAFPLYDRRAGGNAHNLDPVILTALAEAYGEAVAPEDLFDAILALLSATSYTVRFAEDLEDTFPHIPFPADPALFKRAVEIGREIRAVETFAREPAAAFRARDFVRLRSEATGPVDLKESDAQWTFCADGTGSFDGLPPRVWEFSVSGYRVLKRWVEAREGLEGPTYWPQFRDIAARIHELLHWFDEADLVLDKVLEHTLSREELGLLPDDADGDNG